MPDPACEQLPDCHHTYGGELSAISFQMFIVNVFYYSIRRAGFQPVFFILTPFIKAVQRFKEVIHHEKI